MKMFTKALSGALAIVLAAGSLVACGEKKLPDKQVVNHVYKYDQKELYAVKQNSDDENVTVREYIYDTVSNENGWMFLVNKSDKDYNDLGYTLHYGRYGSDTDNSIELPKPESEDGNIYYSNLSRFAEGFGIIAEDNTLVDKENYIYSHKTNLLLYGEDGTLQSTIDLQKAFGIAEDSYMSIERLLRYGDQLLLGYYSEDSNGIVLQTLNLDGTLGKVIPIFPEGAEGYIGNTFFTKDGKLIVVTTVYGTDSSKQTVVTLDLATGERSELDASNDYQLANSLFAGPDGALYCSDQNGVYTVDPATLAKTEILNYINSDYIYQYNSYSVLEDGRFVTFGSKYDSDKKTTTYNVTTFTKVPDDQITPKYLITVASAGYTYNLQEQIVKYNLASDEYRIKFVDYTQYNTEDDPDAGQTRLGDDILAGNVPDVLIADQQFAVSKYISKGLFADLYTFIDKDESMKREDFLENILTGCEIDGKLYELPTNFYIMGLIGPKETIDKFRGLTIREFVDQLKALPDGVSFFRDGDVTRADLLQSLFLINYSNFIDRKTGKCTLNNDECRALLELAKMMPEKSIWDRDGFNSDNFDWDAYNNQFRDGKAIAQTISIGDFSNLQDYSYSYAPDTKLDFVGFPAPDGDGMSFTTANLKFLVSAKGSFTDAAWDFVKIFLSDDYQSNQSWGFPIKKTALEAKKQDMLDQIKRNEEDQNNNDGGVDDGGIVIGTATTAAIAIDDIWYNRQLTAEDVETVYNYVLAAKKQLVYDTSLFDIINEESSAYFAGTKSLDEILPLMESRITIFLSEGR